MRRRYKIATILFLLIWILTAVQFAFSPFKLVGLRGAFTDSPIPDFSFEKLKKGTFQRQVENYATLETPFRADFVRLKNQIGYTFFDEVNTNLTLGKNNYLFDYNYIRAFEGKDLLPYKARITQNSSIGEFKRLMDSLGVNTLWIIAPNKANYYKEFLKSLPKFEKGTNQIELRRICKLNKIPIIDVDHWFLKEKKKSKYPLITKYGAHWSSYGAALVADSLDEFLRNDFPNKVITSIGKIEESKKAKFTDNDYLSSLNLIEKWEWDTILGYPSMNYQPGKKIKALVVSDSYMWNLFQNDFFQQNFTIDSKFLYYNKAIYNIKKEREGDKLNEVNLKYLSNFEIVLFIGTGPSFSKSYSYNFIEELLND